MYEEHKAAARDYLGRWREIVSDPNNARISRVDGAGITGKDPRFADPFVIMHNGIRILLGEQGYYKNFADILIINRGVHEPQEEYAFGKVLELVDGSLPMIELGAYWGFYSLWFKQKFPQTSTYLVEPELERLDVGKANFCLNGQKGEFIQGKISEDEWDLIGFMDNRNITKLSILHADIQGAEGYLLSSIREGLLEKRFEFVFLSTHSQSLHLECMRVLEDSGYMIFGSADFDEETFAYDGVIVAASGENPVAPLNLLSRSRHRIDNIGLNGI